MNFASLLSLLLSRQFHCKNTRLVNVWGYVSDLVLGVCSDLVSDLVIKGYIFRDMVNEIFGSDSKRRPASRVQQKVSAG